MAGRCYSCRVCTRPPIVGLLSMMLLIDLYLWFGRLFIRRCPICHHGIGSHRSHTRVAPIVHWR